MATSRSGSAFGLAGFASFLGLRMLAFATSGRIEKAASLEMPSYWDWWYKDPMFWIVVLLIIRVIFLKCGKK